MTEQRAGAVPARPNLVLAIVVGVVAVLAIVAAVVSTTRTPPPADPATPQGTVQLFVTAVLDGDDEAAVALLDPSLKCTVPLPTRGMSGTRATFAIGGTRLTGERATVEIEVTERRTGNPLDTYSHRESYQLIAHDGGWLIAGEPWPVYTCQK